MRLFDSAGCYHLRDVADVAFNDRLPAAQVHEVHLAVFGERVNLDELGRRLVHELGEFRQHLSAETFNPPAGVDYYF